MRPSRRGRDRGSDRRTEGSGRGRGGGQNDPGRGNAQRGRGGSSRGQIPSQQRGGGNLKPTRGAPGRSVRFAPLPPPAKPAVSQTPTNMQDYYATLKKNREAERAHAIANNLVDDPNKQRRLEDAITFRGTCQDMCPEFERVERIVRQAVDSNEKAPGPDGVDAPDQERMVKRFRRSAAGDEAQLPSDVRPPAVLRKTLDYLIDEIVGGEMPLAKVHAFVWDRTRSIRNDFTLQNVQGFKTPDLQTTIECYELIARFHIHALHQLSRPDVDDQDFVAHNEREQLNKTLLSLMEFYDLCASRGVQSRNEAEFRAYKILMHLHDQHVEREAMDLGRTRPDLFHHARFQKALELYFAAGNVHDRYGPLRPATSIPIAQNNFGKFFRIVGSSRVSYTMACMAEIQFNPIRRMALTAIRVGYRSRATIEDCSMQHLVDILGFDDEAQAQEFCEACGMEVAQGAGGVTYLVLKSGPATLQDPNASLKQPFSQRIVENKRHGRTLPQVIQGLTVRQAREANGNTSDVDGTEEPATMAQSFENTAQNQQHVPQAPGFASAPSTFKVPSTIAAQASSTQTPPITQNPFTLLQPNTETVKPPAQGFLPMDNPLANALSKTPPSLGLARPSKAVKNPFDPPTPGSLQSPVVNPFKKAAVDGWAAFTSQPASSTAANPFGPALSNSTTGSVLAQAPTAANPFGSAIPNNTTSSVLAQAPTIANPFGSTVPNSTTSSVLAQAPTVIPNPFGQPSSTPAATQLQSTGATGLGPQTSIPGSGPSTFFSNFGSPSQAPVATGDQASGAPAFGQKPSIPTSSSTLNFFSRLGKSPAAPIAAEAQPSGPTLGQETPANQSTAEREKKTPKPLFSFNPNPAPSIPPSVLAKPSGAPAGDQAQQSPLFVPRHTEEQSPSSFAKTASSTNAPASILSGTIPSPSTPFSFTIQPVPPSSLPSQGASATTLSKQPATLGRSKDTPPIPATSIFKQAVASTATETPAPSPPFSPLSQRQQSTQPATTPTITASHIDSLPDSSTQSQPNKVSALELSTSPSQASPPSSAVPSPLPVARPVYRSSSKGFPAYWRSSSDPDRSETSSSRAMPSSTQTSESATAAKGVSSTMLSPGGSTSNESVKTVAPKEAAPEPAPPLELPEKSRSPVVAEARDPLEQPASPTLPDTGPSLQDEYNEKKAREFRRRILMERYFYRWRYVAERLASIRYGRQKRARLRQFFAERLEKQTQQPPTTKKKKRKSDSAIDNVVGDLVEAANRTKRRHLEASTTSHAEFRRHRRSRTESHANLVNGAAASAVFTATAPSSESANSCSDEPQSNGWISYIGPEFLSGNSILDSAAASRLHPSIAKIGIHDTTKSDLWRMKAAGFEVLRNGVVQPIGMPSSRTARKRSFDESSGGEEEVRGSGDKAKPFKRMTPSKRFSGMAPAWEPRNSGGLQSSDGRLANGHTYKNLPRDASNSAAAEVIDIESDSDSDSDSDVENEPDGIRAPPRDSPAQGTQENDEDLFSRIRRLNEAMDEGITFYRSEIEKEKARWSHRQQKQQQQQQQQQQRQSQSPPANQRQARNQASLKTKPLPNSTSSPSLQRGQHHQQPKQPTQPRQSQRQSPPAFSSSTSSYLGPLSPGFLKVAEYKRRLQEIRDGV